MSPIKFFFLFLILSNKGFCQTNFDFESLYNETLRNNYLLKKKELEFKKAYNEYQKGKLYFLGKVSGGFSNSFLWGRFVDPYTYNYSNGRLYTNTFYLNSSITLYNGRKYSNLQKSLKVDSDLASNQLESQKLELKRKLLNEVISYYLYSEQFVIISSQIEETKSEIVNVKKLIDAGILTESKIFEFISLQKMQEAFLEEIINKRIFAENNIVNLSGVENIGSVLNPVNYEIDSVSVNINQIEQILDDIIIQSNEYQSLNLSLLKAHFNLQASYSNFLPEVKLLSSVYSGYSSKRYDYSNPLNIVPVPYFKQYYQNFNQSISLAVNVPIFNGFENHYVTNNAKLNTVILEMDKQNFVQNKKSELREIILRYKIGKANYDASLFKYRKCEILFKEDSQKFFNGRLKLSDYFITKLNYNNANIEVIQRKYDLILNHNLININIGMPIILN